jgi:hypothetical protein
MAGAVLVTGGLALAACGGGGGDDGVATLGGDAAGENDNGDESGEKDPEEALQKWAECMREHGVDVPDPQVEDDGGPVIIQGPRDGAAADREAAEEAQAACAKYMEGVVNDGDRPARDPEQEQAMREWALDFAECMRDEGIDFPDPQFQDGGGVLQSVPENQDRSAVETAQKHCEEELGGPPGLEGEGGGPFIEGDGPGGGGDDD